MTNFDRVLVALLSATVDERIDHLSTSLTIHLIDILENSIFFLYNAILHFENTERYDYQSSSQMEYIQHMCNAAKSIRDVLSPLNIEDLLLIPRLLKNKLNTVSRLHDTALLVQHLPRNCNIEQHVQCLMRDVKELCEMLESVFP
jgi:hypothetical protein